MRRLALAGLFALLAAVVLSLLPGPAAFATPLAPAPAASVTDDINPCFLDTDGQLVCPEELYAPPRLLNPAALTPFPGIRASLDRLMDQAVDNTLSDHGLPASDREAVLSYGRAEAQAELWAIVVDALRTEPAQRTADQAAVSAWLAQLDVNQKELAAFHAGQEYVKWAGLDMGDFLDLYYGGASAAELTTFLSGTVLPYDQPEKASSTRGYCLYEAPAPYSTEYDASTMQTCFTPCTSVFGCPAPTPTYDQFVRWGQARGTYGMLNNVGFQDQAAAIAIGATFGGAVVGATAIGVVISATMASLLLSSGVVAVLLPWAGVELYFVATGLMTSAAGLAGGGAAAAAIGGAVAVVILAIVTAVLAGIQVADSIALPGKIAQLISGAHHQPSDPTAMARTEEGMRTLYTMFIGATLPRPAWEEYCDNGVLTLSDYLKARPSQVESLLDQGIDEAWLRYVSVGFVVDRDGNYLDVRNCLNPPPIPAAAPTDPHFLVSPRSAPAQTERTPTISFHNALTGLDSTTRLSGKWFVWDLEGAASRQSLSLNYTDWNGDHQHAWLIEQPDGAYHFLGVSVTPTSETFDPDDCEAKGLCWSSDHLEYVGTDGRQYSASVDLFQGESVGNPSYSPVTPRPVTAQQVSFDANGFAPTGGVPPYTYEWRFQNSGCGTPCTGPVGTFPNVTLGPAYGAPVTGETATHAWQTSGRFSTQLTVTDSQGRKAVKAFDVTVANVPPTLTPRVHCDLTSPKILCNGLTTDVGNAVEVYARVDHTGRDDNEIVTVHWGDGAVYQSGIGPNLLHDVTNPLKLQPTSLTAFLVRGSHTYDQAGIYNVTVSVSDLGGGTDSTTFIQRVRGPQAITFAPISPRRYGDELRLKPAGGGGSAPVVLTAGPEDVCLATGEHGRDVRLVGVGTCTVTANQAASGDIWLAAQPVSRTFSVLPAQLDVRVDDKTKTYGDPEPTYTTRITGLRNGDTAADVAGLVVTGPPADAGAGLYDLVASGIADPNYTVTYFQGRLDVRRAELRITPDDVTRVYGSPKPSYTVDIDGLVGGDTQADLTGLQIDGVPQQSQVGAYSIRVMSVTNPNYDIRYEIGTETITKAPLTVTAKDVSRRYGASATYSASYAGLVNGDAGGAAAVSFTGAPSSSDVGEYPIRVSGSARNYELTLVDGVETVTQAPLTITADDMTRAYGAPSPSYTTRFSGLTNGDSRDDVAGLTVTGAATDADAGAYPIKPVGATNPNYDVRYVNGMETVTPAGLTITADDQTKVYGSPDPDFTAAIDGLVNGDTASDITGLAFDAPPRTSGVGTYAITPKGATNANYTIAFAAGTETITPAPLTIRAEDKSTKYGTLPSLTWRGGGWVNGDGDAGIDVRPACVATVQGSAVSVTTLPGSYPGAIACSGAADANYRIGYASGRLTVNPVIRLAQTGLPSDVPRRATLDGLPVTLPTGDLEISFGSTHSYSFPKVVVSSAGVAYLTTASAFAGPVSGNLTATAAYTTVTNVVATSVAAGGVDKKTADKLNGKWSAVQAGLKSGNLSRTRDALRDFASFVTSQSGKKISRATADLLLAYANQVYASVGGTGQL